MLEKFIALANSEKNNENSFFESKNDFPEEINFLFKNYSNATFIDGYFSLVNSIEYQEVLKEVYTPFKEPSNCFAKDAFGNLYVWENESIKLINIRYKVSEIIGRKPSVFFNLKMTDNGFLEKRLKINMFYEAKKKLGELKQNECYGYEPLLTLGGSEKVEFLKKVKIKEHISIIAQLTGKIE
ncbi:DUF1851 domain-containing protein [Maribacter sp. BPC-D8]|uniref:T6SS immunity protein Tdi1 domain-containing protein n=1 Tax=Maribacter sp. BPC-D8 TaxID=3053613 RepID=UPI002B4802DF|nr:T6SS immunity protein Tdi1 domain-containing protein [Maribacter sp. BPC-D8]WRI28593.1 DUF1851 domain-containing protein [Maribacter sp. BPC-D8]